MSEKQVITGVLKNWTYDGTCLIGSIYNDINGRFQDGTFIRTSYVTDDESAIIDNGIVRTRNSIYALEGEIKSHK